MPTTVWIWHPATRSMMLVCTRFHGSDPHFLILAVLEHRGCLSQGGGCKTWGIAMSESMFVAHFSFAHSCCFLCAISGVTYYAISAFDSNPRFRSQKLIPTANFNSVFAFLMLH